MCIRDRLIDRITTDIISGKYKPGDKLEPVRELAVTAGVNPNTMQRALAIVEEIGLIYTKRGDGRYVSEDSQNAAAAKDAAINKNVNELIQSLKNLGLDNDSIVARVQAALSDKQGG